MPPPPRKLTTQSGPPPRKTIEVRAQAKEVPTVSQILSEAKQDMLFEVEEEWQKQWKGMPEYVQEEQEPFMSIKVHFNNYEDAKEFAEKLGLRITPETKYLWYPKIDLKRVSTKRYVSDKPEPISDDGADHMPDCDCEVCKEAWAAFNQQ